MSICLIKERRLTLGAKQSQKLGTIRAELSAAQAHLDKISELEGICPTCEQEIDWNQMERLILCISLSERGK